MKTYDVSSHKYKKYLTEALLISTHNICFCGEARNIYLVTPLVCSCTGKSIQSFKALLVFSTQSAQVTLYVIKKYTFHSSCKAFFFFLFVFNQNELIFYFFFFFFFDLGFMALFKNISLISSQSFSKGGRKPENPGKNHHTIHKQNLAFHM